MTAQSGMARNWGNTQTDLGELFENLPHEQTKEERFAEFIAANPEFVQWVIRRALDDLEAGRRGSMKRYFEDARDSQTVYDSGEYKLNNDFTSLMARHVMDVEPRLVGFFETRGLWGPTRKVRTGGGR